MALFDQIHLGPVNRPPVDWRREADVHDDVDDDVETLASVDVMRLLGFNPLELYDEWREESHPRVPAGSPGGGQFGSSGSPGSRYSSTSYVKNGVIYTKSVHDAARALWEGRKVELTQVRSVSTLIEHLGQVSSTMVRMGGSAPNFNLCNVSIAGTNLFCADSEGIPRVKMPQLDKDQTKALVRHLRNSGYDSEKTKERASYLRATQNELVGAKVAANAAKFRAGKAPRRIILSRDNYILDGHHKWAAKIGIDTMDGKLGDEEMKVWRFDISITKLLAEAEKFSGQRKSGDAWKEEDHPRVPSGSTGGGRFGSSGEPAIAPGLVPPVVSDGGIVDYLKMVAEAQSHLAETLGTSPAQFMLDHGQAFPFDDTAFAGKQGPQKQCFMNAALAALADKGTYVEGYVSVHGVPLAHAWIVNDKGHVIDPTIRVDVAHGGGVEGYFGVPVRLKYLLTTLQRSKVYGIFQHNNIKRILTDDPKTIVASIKIKVGDFDPDQPRDPEGKWTSGGGHFAIGPDESQPATQLLAHNLGPETIEDVYAKLSVEAREALDHAKQEVSSGVPTNAKVEVGGNVQADGTYTAERQALHVKILRDMFTPEAVAGARPAAGATPTLVMLGGRPASGKTTAVRGTLSAKEAQGLYISADTIQEHLPGYRPGLAGLYNQEGQDIALLAEGMARKARLNIIYDATMKTASSAEGRVREYVEAGYDVEGYFVHTTPAISAVRSVERFMKTGRYLTITAARPSRLQREDDAKMTTVLIETRGGPLTDDDFEGDAPPPGSSDRRYSEATLAELDDILGLDDIVDEWKEEDHPRVPEGSPGGGQFGTSGGTAETAESTAGLNSAVIDVGGDDWNKATAIRLEREYVAVRDKLDATVARLVGTTSSISSEPGSWGDLDETTKDWAEEVYKDNQIEGAIEGEVSSWWENEAPGEARSGVIDDFNSGDETGWVERALYNYRNENSGTVVIPYLNSQVLAATKLGFSGVGIGVQVKLDEGVLQSFHQELTEMGRTPPTAESLQQMKSDLASVIEEAFDKQVDFQVETMESPDFTEQAGEVVDMYWSELSDDEKYELAKEAPGEPPPETSSGTVIQLPEAFDPMQLEDAGADSTNYKRTQALARSLSIERAVDLMIERKALPADANRDALRKEVAALDSSVWSDWKSSSTSTKGKFIQLATADELGGRLRSGLWQTWKGPSTDPIGNVVSPEQRNAASKDEFIHKANNEFRSVGGYNGFKAYIRAKWETTQYLLDKADMQTVRLFRGIRIDMTDSTIESRVQNAIKTLEGNQPVPSNAWPPAAVYPVAMMQLPFNRQIAHLKKELKKIRAKSIKPLEQEAVTGKDGGQYAKFPTVEVVRNGAASTTVNRKVANGWGGSNVILRALVPRTAVLSVPAYGINITHEREVVIAGTAWIGWDAWKGDAPFQGGGAPSFDDVPLLPSGMVRSEPAARRESGNG